MWKYLSKIFLAAFVVVSVGFFQPLVTSAIGADTVVKAVGGKAVIRALSEKAGMALSPKQLDNVVDRIEQKSYAGDAKAIDFLNKSNALVNNPSTEPSLKTGFKKYVVDPALWLSGLDLVFDAIDAFSDGYNNNTLVELYDDVDNYGISWLQINRNSACYGSTSNPQDGVRLTLSNGVSTDIGCWASSIYEKPVQFVMVIKETKSDANGNVIVVADTKVKKLDGTWHETERVIDFATPYSDYDESVKEKPRQISVSDTDIVNTDNSSTIKNSFDNDTYNTNTTYNLEIDMPDTVTTNNVDYGDTTIWNEKDSNIEVEVGSPPPPTDGDSDGDGIPDDDGRGDAIDVLVRVDDAIPIHEKFFLEMADMGQKIEDMYNGVVHFFDVSIDGFTTLTSGMTGFVSFLDSFFDWLPSEYVALLGSGFTLGVVSFFLRR